jgi:hypothetical protein
LRACRCWVPLALYVLTFAGLPATASVLCVVGLLAVAFDPPGAGVPVAGVPDVTDILAIASVPADPGVPVLLHSVPYCTCSETY